MLFDYYMGVKMEPSNFSKFFNFSDKKPGFSKTIELYLNFYIGFCIT